MFLREKEISCSSMFNEKNQVFYDEINKELCSINIDLKRCEKNLEEICECIMKEYAESQMIINPLIFEDALNLVTYVEELKGKHLD
ncbi:unnamed protein product [Hymenolepis diminuta]|uniref:Uncharacterized protein n=1 Tax=Hymenolepis diminuta TaxID=6216 RepID=A0A564YGC9_HYMDI|nr:unnamed protein product [Hymenolepis diminuta]